MKLTHNLSLNRYEWAAKKIAEICAAQAKKVNLFDIGSRDNVLKQYLDLTQVTYSAFDMDPIDPEAYLWNIEHPFPYDHKPPQIISLLEVVEHLNNPWLSFKNLADVIEPGGHLILTTPNPSWSTSRINMLNKGFLTCFTVNDLKVNHHVFIAYQHIVEKLLNDNHFEIVEYVTLDGDTKLFNKDLKLSSLFLQLPARAVKKAIEKRDPTSKGMSYGIVAKRIDG
jgi:hypothetical protein